VHYAPQPLAIGIGEELSVELMAELVRERELVECPVGNPDIVRNR
jgi:hypothetical protein